LPDEWGGRAWDVKALIGGIREFREVQNQLNSAPLFAGSFIVGINSDGIVYNNQVLRFTKA
jgi:hypothetical protein